MSSGTSGVIDIMRTVLLVAVVFLVGLIIGVFDIFLVPVLFYAFWYYYKKSKKLQQQMELTAKPETAPGMPPQENVPPSSTDA